MESQLSKIDEIADSILGKPYVHLGRGPDAYDCFGALLHLYQGVGISIPDVVAPLQSSMGKVDVIEDVLPQYDRLFEQVALPAQPLDIIDFVCDGINHVAPVLDRTFALHVTRSQGVCRIRYAELLRRSRHRALYRLRSWKND